MDESSSVSSNSNICAVRTHKLVMKSSSPGDFRQNLSITWNLCRYLKVLLILCLDLDHSIIFVQQFGFVRFEIEMPTNKLRFSIHYPIFKCARFDRKTHHVRS